MKTPLCAGTCTMNLLSPLIYSEVIRFENGDRIRSDFLTAEYQKKLKCVQDGVAALKGTTSLTSAWRPYEYQRHLYEIINADRVLDGINLQDWPGCKKLREEVTREMNKHGLKSGQAVARPGTSRHELGHAFDITINGITDEQRANVYRQCNVTNTAVTGEPWHVE
ncbi:unnamed protein product [Rotaria sordida]|uniref:D-alanyl-D-alanine carboxypeptidase-like core domain-containing protein n=1 Tax=Rotaria sordida TaxID=392033 RepID=A0A814IUG8_9BILA|nr:unnamed protein product [Rotaria sordida]CAF4193805.1 unnamed protein product [Rotaria sordida]